MPTCSRTRWPPPCWVVLSPKLTIYNINQFSYNLEDHCNSTHKYDWECSATRKSFQGVRGYPIDRSMLASPKARVLYLSACFSVLFMAYSSAQNYQTTRSASVGSTTLGILYSTFTLSNLLSSSIVSLLGAKISLLLGASAYVLFVASNIQPVEWTQYVAGAVLGFGASLLWTAQGAAVTGLARLDPSEGLGYYNGLFFSIFQFNQFAGNLLVALLFQYEITPKVIFSLSTVVGGVGAFLLLFTRLPPSTPSPSWGNFSQLRDTPMQLLLLFFVANGCSQSFMFGTYPSLIHELSTKFYAMSVFGLSDTLFSILVGYSSDAFGRVPVLLLGLLVHLGVFSLIVLVDVNTHEALIYGSAICLGISDAVWNTQAYAILGHIYHKDPGAAFSNFKLCQSGAMALAFYYSPYTSIGAQALVCVAAMTLGVVLVVVLNKTVQCIEPDRLEQEHTQLL